MISVGDQYTPPPTLFGIEKKPLRPNPVLGFCLQFLLFCLYHYILVKRKSFDFRVYFHSFIEIGVFIILLFKKKFKKLLSNFVNFETFKMVKVFSYNVPLSLIGITYHLNDNYIVNILVHFLYAFFHLNSSIQNSCWLPNINTTYWIYNINKETPQLLILFLYAFTFF